MSSSAAPTSLCLANSPGPMVKKVHFSESSTRRALSTIKQLTNRPIQSIKDHYRVHQLKRAKSHQSLGSQHSPFPPTRWISDAATISTFSNPRDFKSPLRSCLRRTSEGGDAINNSRLRSSRQVLSMRSIALGRYDMSFSDDDKHSLIDVEIDHNLIDSLWAPLTPTPYVPACIGDLQGLFE